MTKKIRFNQFVRVGDTEGTEYQEGDIIDVNDASFDRWLRRGVCDDVSVPVLLKEQESKIPPETQPREAPEIKQPHSEKRKK